MATKLCMVLNYDEGNSPMISRDSLITWSRQFTWQFKSLIPPILQTLFPPNLTGW